MNNKGKIAIMQIILLVVGIIAITYMLGSSIGIVSAEEEGGECDCPSHCTVSGNWVSGGFCDDNGECHYTSSVPDPSRCPELEPIDSIQGQIENPRGGFVDTLIGVGEGALGAAAAEIGRHYVKKHILKGTIKAVTEKGIETAVTTGAEGSVTTAGEKILADIAAMDMGAGTGETAVTFAETNPVFAQFVGIAISAAIAVSVGLLVRYGAEALGASVSQAQSLAWAASAGTFTTLALSGAHFGSIPLGFFGGAGGIGSALGISSSFLAGAIAPGIGLVIGAIVFFATFKKESAQTVTFQCNAWDAKGGDEVKNNCELCNRQGILPCTEYQCESLGKQCELINVGTDEAMCVYTSINDLEYPIIEPWEDILLENFKYTPDGRMSPPDRGVYVDYTKSSDKCVPPFTRLSFGVTLNEPGKCKISPERTSNFKEMGNVFLSGSNTVYNHSYTTSIPGGFALEAEEIPLENGGNYEIFVRCEDDAENSNLAEFVFKFCIEDGPDLTEPTITITSPFNQAPISYGTESIEMTAYVNKPSDCKWSRLDQSYDSMENTMTCAQSVTEMNALQLYKCQTTLDGLKNSAENNFYFKCKSYPMLEESERITMQGSYEYTLIGTQPLLIDEITPNDTIIEDSTSVVEVNIEVKTSAGYNEGQAFCYYSATGKDKDYNLFGETDSYEHSQKLFLPEGDYEYKIKCIDLGGNAEVQMINFHVESDTEAPIIVRVYYENDNLNIITNEEAECRYGTASNIECNYDFELGTLMLDVDNLLHYVEWDSDLTFYIKCKEDRETGIPPAPDKCTMIVRPFDIYS